MVYHTEWVCYDKSDISIKHNQDTFVKTSNKQMENVNK